MPGVHWSANFSPYYDIDTPGMQDYPFTLDREAIELLLPHRGPIFACTQLVAHGPRVFTGTACWAQDNAVIQGHFPGYPIVPGVMLIEAATQLAGAGLMATDARMQSIAENCIGVLASVQRCTFKRPVSPEQDVAFEIDCRQIGGTAVKVSAHVHVGDLEVAQLESLMIYTDRGELSATSRYIPP